HTLNELSSNSVNEISKLINEKQKEYEALTMKYTELANMKDELYNKLSEYNDAYQILSKINIDYLNSIKNDINSKVNEIESMKSNVTTIYEYQSRIQEINSTILKLKLEFNELSSKNDSIRTTINNLKYFNEEYSKLIDRFEYLKLILDATS